jgi:hypothetical protein
MDYREYLQRVKLISELGQATPLKESEDAFLQFILSDFLDLDKTELSVIPASLYNRKGDTEAVLPWFDKGIACNQLSCHFEVLEKHVIAVQYGSK